MAKPYIWYIFLNPEEIGDCFFEDFIGTMPGGEMLQQLTDYLMENYIDPVLTQALGVSEQ